MNLYVLSIFISSLALGTTLVFSTDHWIVMWIGLEINTLAIIPLMAQQHHPRAVEATTKYFLTQATASAMFLFACTINAWKTGTWNATFMADPIATNLAIMALALKMGLAPLHFWLPEVLQGISLTTGLLLSTWQKLAPFLLMFRVTHDSHSLMLTALGMTSILIGGWGGLNQTQVRKILAYSSIAHLGWMVLVIQMAPKMSILALLTYFAMTSAAFLTLNKVKATNIATMATAWVKAPALSALASLVLLSLGGLPPLTGFMPKWFILQELTMQLFFITATISALGALLSLYFYLRLTYAMALTVAPHMTLSTTPWRTFKKSTSLPLAFTTISATCLLPLAPTALLLLF
uniref:NADH-ubiquinone oxidoreductase chain 2 n=1 Tax=Sundasalanx sp. Chao Phraya TaxID=689625 RepID=H1UC17_9TELE|nr:NADH dehydrogenase subunit 2 [Sundasalanx sp. Chao Phraya]BAL43688.1 NADH dehydrogenase subunit 2 [Sundasalanx sp. Chao Phraya]